MAEHDWTRPVWTPLRKRLVASVICAHLVVLTVWAVDAVMLEVPGTVGDLAWGTLPGLAALVGVYSTVDVETMTIPVLRPSTRVALLAGASAIFPIYLAFGADVSWAVGLLSVVVATSANLILLLVGRHLIRRHWPLPDRSATIDS